MDQLKKKKSSESLRGSFPNPNNNWPTRKGKRRRRRKKGIKLWSNQGIIRILSKFSLPIKIRPNKKKGLKVRKGKNNQCPKWIRLIIKLSKIT